MQCKKFQSGVSLLEVMIAMLVLGIGLLGVAALQASSVRNTQNSYERTMAIVMVDSVIESIRANPNAAPGAYAMSDCSPASGGLIAEQLTHWVTRLKQELGDSVQCSIVFNTDRYVVEISWKDERQSDTTETLIRTAVVL
ncbi:type IV pilus modification protein PilV [Alkalimonas sp.]|uniref:type IV pilus modification protein PilV n=1 Tax=Alkalimonas sp. TaxID=1872453 RepID=UPI00263AF871|nr:type IV pilus modification protein PilV [Alkalimonas sp.]MCC5826461.1 type IV pilus modification protein PilV [Alkalimonas sp.]